MRIDGHAHACGSFLTAEGISESLEKNHLDMVVLTPGEWGSTKTYRMKNRAEERPFEDVVLQTNRMTTLAIPLTGAIKKIPEGNRFVYGLRSALPQQVRQAYWITQNNPYDLDAEYDSMHFSLLKFHQCWERFDIGGDWFRQRAEWAAQKDIPLFIHMRGYNDVKKLIACIKESPNLTVIVAHLFGLDLFLRDDLSRFDRVFFDVSNSYFVSRERILQGLRHFGSSKFLFGSDTPYGEEAEAITLRGIERPPISEGDKERILGENLRELLGL